MTETNSASRRFRRVVILGHTGFIGTRLEQTVRLRWPGLEVVGCSLPAVDLTKAEDARSLAHLLDDETAVVMCATIKRQFGDTQEAFIKNVTMVMHLCDVLRERVVGRLVFFSSAAVYGEDVHNSRITEETPVEPTSYYGMAKYISERLLWKTLGQREGQPVLILRPPLIYGSGDQAGTYGPSGFIRAALQREPVVFWGDGTEQREFLFLDDAVELVCRLMVHEWSGVVNLASGRSDTFKGALEAVCRLSGVTLPVTSRPRTKAKVDNGFDNSRLKGLLPDFSFTGLEEGIRMTLEAESQRRASMNPESVGVRP